MVFKIPVSEILLFLEVQIHNNVFHKQFYIRCQNLKKYE